MNTHKMHFQKVTGTYKDTILKWFNEEHVKKFYYGEGLQNTLYNLELYFQEINDNGRYSFDHWLAFLDKVPFGFLMTSPITGPYDENDNYNKWYIDGKQTFALDLLIGEKLFLGKGFAHQMIQAFILDKFPEADFFIIDPERSNTKAIHVYEKAGFNTVGEFCPEYDPIPHVLMRLSVKELKSMSNDLSKKSGGK